MHISEGVLSGPVLAGGGILAVGLTALGLRSLTPERVVRVGLLAAAFYVASLVHVPVGPASAHLVLNGLLGLLLGWAAVPAILAALTLQAVMFGYGGLTTLGVNTVIMAAPAVVCGLGVRPLLRAEGKAFAAGAFACGALAVLLSGVLAAMSLALSGEAFLPAAGLLLTAHLPVAAVEGLITAFMASFLRRTRPALFHTAT